MSKFWRGIRSYGEIILIVLPLFPVFLFLSMMIFKAPFLSFKYYLDNMLLSLYCCVIMSEVILISIYYYFIAKYIGKISPSVFFRIDRFAPFHPGNERKILLDTLINLLIGLVTLILFIELSLWTRFLINRYLTVYQPPYSREVLSVFPLPAAFIAVITALKAELTRVFSYELLYKKLSRALLPVPLIIYSIAGGLLNFQKGLISVGIFFVFHLMMFFIYSLRRNPYLIFFIHIAVNLFAVF